MMQRLPRSSTPKNQKTTHQTPLNPEPLKVKPKAGTVIPAPKVNNLETNNLETNNLGIRLLTGKSRIATHDPRTATPTHQVAKQREIVRAVGMEMEGIRSPNKAMRLKKARIILQPDPRNPGTHNNNNNNNNVKIHPVKSCPR